jgi:hypothetical protein
MSVKIEMCYFCGIVSDVRLAAYGLRLAVTGCCMLKIIDDEGTAQKY